MGFFAFSQADVRMVVQWEAGAAKVIEDKMHLLEEVVVLSWKSSNWKLETFGQYLSLFCLNKRPKGSSKLEWSPETTHSFIEKNKKSECLDWCLFCLKRNYLKCVSDPRLCKHLLTTVYWWAAFMAARIFHSCRNTLTIQSLKVEVGCLLLFTPSGNAVQWVLLHLCVAQGFVLLTLPVWQLALPGGSVVSSMVMVQLGHEENRLDLYLGEYSFSAEDSSECRCSSNAETPGLCDLLLRRLLGNIRPSQET